MHDEKLNAAARKRLATSAYAMPASRSYPIPDINHARVALARLSQALNAHRITQAQHDAAVARVYAKYPQLRPKQDAAAYKPKFHVGQPILFTYRSAKDKRTGSHELHGSIHSVVKVGTEESTTEYEVDPGYNHRPGESKYIHRFGASLKAA